MVTILLSIAGYLFRAVKLASRIAFSRVTVIFTFVGSLGATVAYVFQSLTDESSFVSDFYSNLSSFSLTLTDWVAGNDYLQVVGYGLSLDVLLDGLVSSLIWISCTLVGILITVGIYLFYAVLPLLADLILSGLRKQQERIQNAITG